MQESTFCWRVFNCPVVIGCLYSSVLQNIKQLHQISHCSIVFIIWCKKASFAGEFLIARFVFWVFVFLDCQPLPLILGPRSLTPISLALRPQNTVRTNLWIKHITIQDYTYSRLKHYTYSRYSKSYLERPNCTRLNGKAFHHSSFFFINNKRNGKKFMVKYIQ